MRALIEILTREENVRMQYEILIMLIPIVVAGIVFALSRVGLDGSMDSTPGKIVIVVAIIGFFVYGGFVLHVLAML